MRVVVTGAGNPFGASIVRALLEAGHAVRVFGVDASQARGLGDVQWHPGDLAAAGSIEPVLSEREVVVHAACMDPPGDDRVAHAIKLERGTLYVRYGVEREQVDHFLHVAPAEMKGRFTASQQKAIDTAEGTRGVLHVEVLRVATPEQAAADVLDTLATHAHLGKQPGRETDAVTA